MKKIFYLFFCSLMISNIGTAQVTYEKSAPFSFNKRNLNDVPVVAVPTLSYDKLLKEDEEDEKKSVSPRFGHLHDVEYTLENSGQWETLTNGDRLWRLTIYAPLARTINLNYSQYDVPKGAKLHIYNNNRSDVLGPFTHMNENIDGQFATGFTKGEYCTLEYYEPAEVKGQSTIAINGIIHGYKSIPSLVDDLVRDFQGSGTCNYDVECALSAGWEDQIKSVGLIMTAGNNRFCSGALISNTAGDCRPYFLTAYHCYSGSVATGQTTNNIYMFNYHSPTPACPGTPTTDGPTNQTVQGATVRAQASASDFLLLELNNNPLDFYDVYYAGWNRANGGATNSVGIHHPDLDVKKFSVDNNAPTSDTYTTTAETHWRVGAWEDGTTEGGSSGSPLFDQNKRIIGQLHGGGASCFNTGASDWYGKVWYSWDQNGGGTGVGLASWLDPSSSGSTTIDGTDCSTPMLPVADFSPNSGSIDICGTSGTINFTDLSTGGPTSWTWNFSGAGVSPMTSTAQNPTVTVNSSGTLLVTFTAANGQGSDNASGSITINILAPTDPLCAATPCLDFPANGAGPYFDFSYADACFLGGCPQLVADYEVYENEAYTLVGLRGGTSYTFEHCTNYNAATWASILTVGEYDSATNAAVPSSELAVASGCSVTFTAPNDGDYIVVVSGEDNCGGAENETDNGIPTFQCNGATACSPVCGSSFTDAGGNTFGYLNEQNKVYTICPDNPTCEFVEVTFTAFDVEGDTDGGSPTDCYDVFNIYDGNSIVATQIGGEYCNTPGPGSPGTVTSSDASGCLTFEFISDAFVNAPGWDATISCVDNGSCGGCNNIEMYSGNISSGLYEAAVNINTSLTTTVATGSNVTFQAGTDIDLNEGFCVQAGGEFLATIAPCFAGSNPVEARNSNEDNVPLIFSQKSITKIIKVGKSKTSLKEALLKTKK